MNTDKSNQPRALSLTAVNCSIATTPFPVTCLRAFVPFNQQSRHTPFVAKSAWRSAINGIKALKRLKLNVGDNALLRSELVVASGHDKGQLLLWNADNFSTLNSATHYNNVTVVEVVVTNTRVLTVVARAARSTQADDADVYVWDMNTMALVTTLTGHEDRVTCLAVSAHSEDHVITGSADRSLLEWMLPSRTPIARYTGHTNVVTHVTFLFGCYFASGAADSTMRVWSTNVRRPRPTELQSNKPLSRRPSHIPSSNQLKSLASQVRQVTAEFVLEGHMGQISYLENMSEDVNITRAASAASSRMPAATNKAGLPRGVVLLSACQGGFVRAHKCLFEPKGASTDPCDFVLTTAPALAWSNKAHKALVTDVCWDHNVIASCSTVDGVSFYHSETKFMNKLHNFDTGVRHLAIDSSRKLILCGCDNGQLFMLSYAGFAAEGGRSGDFDSPVVQIASFQPHVSAISGILLERSTSGQWERVITTSSDRTVFIIDFDTTRDAKVFPAQFSPVLPGTQPAEVIRHAIAPIAGGGSVLLTGGSAGHIWDVAAMGRKMSYGKSLDVAPGHDRLQSIAVCCHYADQGKLVCGSHDGKLRFWNVFFSESDSPKSPQHHPLSPMRTYTTAAERTDPAEGADEVIKASSEPGIDFEEFGVRCLSEEAANGVIGVGLQRRSTPRSGGVCLVSLSQERQSTNVLATQYVPVQVRCHAYEIPLSQVPQHDRRGITAQGMAHRYVCILQLRNGEIQIFHTNSEGLNLLPLRTIAKEQHPYIIEQDLDGTLPMPLPFYSSLNTRFDPPRLDVTLMDKGALRSVQCATTMENVFATLCQMPFFEVINTTGSGVPIQPTTWVPVRCCGFMAAVALESGIVTIVSEGAESAQNATPLQMQQYRALDILYDGGVVDRIVEAVTQNRRRRGLIMMESIAEKSPVCTAIAVSPHARALVLGYRDGIIQLWDMATKRVFRRICAFPAGKPVHHLLFFGREGRVLSMTDGEFRFDTVYTRNIRDAKTERVTARPQKLTLS